MNMNSLLSDGDVKRDPWGQQSKYAKGMSWACFGLIVIASLGAASSKASLASKRTRLSGFVKLQALVRAVAYRPTLARKGHSLDVRLPALGATILMCALMASFTVWAFVVQPYYRLDRTYGSPPLGLRAGMMAVGLLPFVYALSSKVNFIGMVTRTSHERLQVYHQWASRFMLFLATVHTIPFIYQPLRDGRAAYLKEMFFSDSINTTGVIAYVCLFFLVCSSFRCLRDRFYEVWVVLHVVVAIVFLVYMFIHCQNLLTSWRYLWGGAALYGLSLFLRLARVLQQSSFLLVSYAEVEALPEGLTKLTIPTLARWKPGQHIFIRFPALQPWANHPFTIVSQPSKDPHAAVSHVVLMAQAHAGLTQKLHARAARHQKEHAFAGAVDTSLSSPLVLPVIVDGPYGCDASVAEYDHVLFLAGGSGGTFIVSSLLDLICRWRAGTATTKTAEVVWSVKKEARLDWLKEQLDVACRLAPPDRLRVTLHVTNSDVGDVQSDPVCATTTTTLSRTPAEPSLPEADKDSIATTETSSSSYPGTIHRSARADVLQLIGQFARQFSIGEGRKIDEETDSPKERVTRGIAPLDLAVVVCGPGSMTKDAASASAQVQVDIVRGRLSHVASLRLLSERFGW